MRQTAKPVNFFVFPAHPILLVDFSYLCSYNHYKYGYFYQY
jgi:hypothetical protein